MSTFWIIFISAWLSSGLTVWLASFFNGEMDDLGEDRTVVILTALVVALLISGPGVLLVSLGFKMGAEKANDQKQ